MDNPVLRLHLEPDRPIEVVELVGALSSVASQYRSFAVSQGLPQGDEGARLLIASVTPGSIDINFVPDAITTAAVLAPMVQQLDVIHKFAEHIKWLLDGFLGSKRHGQSDVSVKDCDDAINIVRPTANNGGSQHIQVIRGDVNLTVLQVGSVDARALLNAASLTKARLQAKGTDIHERVALVWKRIDRDALRTSGTSPDKAVIEELDPKPKPVLFTDDMAPLKQEMVREEDNPMRMVYFVDVQVSTVEGRIVSYRVLGYHGKEPLD
jgi:hypothetical protein